MSWNLSPSHVGSTFIVEEEVKCDCMVRVLPAGRLYLSCVSSYNLDSSGTGLKVLFLREAVLYRVNISDSRDGGYSAARAARSKKCMSVVQLLRYSSILILSVLFRENKFLLLCIRRTCRQLADRESQNEE